MALATGSALSQTYEIIDPGPGGQSSPAIAVSADGSVIAGGTSQPEGSRAYRWTEADGLVVLPATPGGEYMVNVDDMSPDGSLIVGRTLLADGLLALMWTEAGGTQVIDLPGVSTSDYYIRANAAGNDGVISGNISAKFNGGGGPFEDRSFLRLPDGSFSLLELAPSGNKTSSRAVTPDGSVVVGAADLTQPLDDFHRFHPYRWTSEGADLLDGPSERLEGTATDITPDGSFIVGYHIRLTESGAFAGSPRLWFRWSEESGVEDLPVLTGQDAGSGYVGALESPVKVSADGSVVVGRMSSGDASRQVPAIWREGVGTENLLRVLREEYGLDVQETFPARSDVTGISDDGTVIIGYTSKGMGWRAVIPPRVLRVTAT
ncbi:MAG: hypothetical protein WBA11_03435, partial [Rubrivirga sp.]